jgi:FAD/FMN-containing dehydrogenase
MLDLSQMNSARVDPSKQLAWVEGGALLGALDRESLALGLATTAGTVSHTGVGGLTTGGGFGRLGRRFGLACDNVRSFDVVTADGKFLTANAQQNKDLYWGLRGGGGNFGVVTQFEYRLHQVGPQVVAGTVFYPASEGASVLRRYHDYVNAAPDDLMTIISMRPAPPAPHLPASVHGKPIIGILALASGSTEHGEQLVAPLRRLGTLIADTIAAKPYVSHQRAIDALFPQGWRNYWKASQMADFGPDAIDAALPRFASIPSRLMSLTIWQLGGAIARVGAEETAYGHRNARYALNIPSVWSDPAEDETNIRWTRETFDAMAPFSDGVYVNFLGNEGDERVRAAYRASTFERLAALKRKYDPTNFFRLNQNIKPAPAARRRPSRPT